MINNHTATALPDGRVLVAGGDYYRYVVTEDAQRLESRLAGCFLYHPGGVAPGVAPVALPTSHPPTSARNSDVAAVGVADLVTGGVPAWWLIGGVAATGGVVAGAVVARRWPIRARSSWSAADEQRRPGTNARVTWPIRASGTGEIVYTKGGTRQVAGARADDGRSIPRGVEVIVLRYERGLAYVQPWDDCIDELAEAAPE